MYGPGWVNLPARPVRATVGLEKPVTSGLVILLMRVLLIREDWARLLQNLRGVPRLRTIHGGLQSGWVTWPRAGKSYWRAILNPLHL